MGQKGSVLERYHRSTHARADMAGQAVDLANAAGRTKTLCPVILAPSPHEIVQAKPSRLVRIAARRCELSQGPAAATTDPGVLKGIENSLP